MKATMYCILYKEYVKLNKYKPVSFIIFPEKKRKNKLLLKFKQTYQPGSVRKAERIACSASSGLCEELHQYVN